MDEERSKRIRRKTVKTPTVRLREYREEKGLTQTELGKLVDVNWRTISAYENETRKPPIKKAVKLARIFNVQVDEIFPV